MTVTRTKRIPLAERPLPPYTRIEESINMVTHIIGGFAALLVLIGSIIIGAVHGNPWAVVSGCIYGVTTAALFVVSSVYHGMRDCLGKRVMQVIDHCTIYFMIAGTYTPILLVGVRELNPAAAWTVFGVEFGCACFAAALTAIDLKKYSKLSMIAYLAMGWAVVTILPETVAVMTVSGFGWLLGGGVVYSVGAVLYGLGKKHRYVHCVFHLFVNAGALLQAVAILRYVL